MLNRLNADCSQFLENNWDVNAAKDLGRSAKHPPLCQCKLFTTSQLVIFILTLLAKAVLPVAVQFIMFELGSIVI